MIKHNQYVSVLMFCLGMTLPVTQGGKIQGFSLCLMPHRMLRHSILIIDLFICVSYYIVSPSRVGHGTWVIFSPETSIISGTKIMAKYIFVEWLAHPQGDDGAGPVGVVRTHEPAGKRRALMTEKHIQK